MKLEFEMLESNDAHYAKRAPVPGGYIYMFTDWDDDAGRSQATACCFVPDQPIIASLDELFREKEDKSCINSVGRW